MTKIISLNETPEAHSSEFHLRVLSNSLYMQGKYNLLFNETIGLETFPYDMTLIATATASDGIDEIWYLIAWAGLILSYGLGIVTLTMSMISRGSRMLGIGLAVTGAAVSLFPILFVLHIYRIDFVAVGGDGTSASPPILSVMIWPLLPFFICVVAGGIAYAHRKSPTTTL